MNSKTVFAIAAFATLASAAARADDITVDNTPFKSQLTRAEVQADLMQYRQAGVNPWSTSYNPLKTFQSSLTREQVRNEFLGDRQAVAALTSEDSGSAYLSKLAAANSRADRTNLAGTPANAN